MVVTLFDLIYGLLWVGIFFQFYDYGRMASAFGYEGHIGKAIASWQFGENEEVFGGIEIGHEDGTLQCGFAVEREVA